MTLLVALAIAATQAGAEAGPWWQPPQQLTWFWQLQGGVSNDHAVAAYDIDGFETDAGEVAALHAEGKHVICYIDVGTAESFRPDYASFPKTVLGRSNGWPGERWLDIRQLGVIESVMTARFRMCREKGFDAVEPDNVEAFSNKSGFPITAQQQLSYNEWVAGEPVLNAEYRESTKKFCVADEAAGIMGVRYALSLNGRRFEPC